MSKELFVNVGKDIKSVAKTIANWILGFHVVLACVFASVACIMLSEDISIGWVGFLIALLLIISGYALSRMTVMFMYAYGEITDRLISIDSKMNCSSRTPNADKTKSDENPVAKAPTQPTAWKCSLCGHTNPADARFCEECAVLKA